MVSSYLICDLCGQFGPPAGFLHENGLRLCYECWYRERQTTMPPTTENGSSATDPAHGTEPPDQNKDT